MFFYLYNILIWILTIIFLPFIFLVLKTKGMSFIPYIKGFSREELAKIQGRKIIWVQASSVGETVLAARLIKEISSVLPGYSIVFTCMTATGHATAQRILTGSVDLIGYFPFDHPLIVRRFFKKIQPAVLILIETELWPNVLREARRRGVKTSVINGRLSDRSYLRMKKIKIIRPLFQLVDLYCVQSQLDLEKFVALGAPSSRIQITGNAKFDQEYPEVPVTKKKEFLTYFSLSEQSPVFTAASTHRGEDEIIIAAFLEIKKQRPKTFLILAPRHPERVSEIEKLISIQNLKWVRRSKMLVGENPIEPVEILLLDTFGELSLAYSLASITFVGGSLVPIGGHNILEAAAQKKAVLYGPYMHNFLESRSLLEEIGVGITINNREELVEKFLFLEANSSFRETLGEKARNSVLSNQGAAARTIQELKYYLTNNKIL